jgi:hypothetical protein
MRLLAEEEFLSWAVSLEIGPDARYSPPRTLTYLSGKGTWKPWPLFKAGTKPFWLIKAALLSLEDWAFCRIWKRVPTWNYPYPEPDGANGDRSHIWNLLIHSDLIPEGFTGAIEFARSEIAEVIRIMFAQGSLGFTVYDDVFVVPDHGRGILYVDHHDAIVAEFPSQLALRTFAERMAKAGCPEEGD